MVSFLKDLFGSGPSDVDLYVPTAADVGGTLERHEKAVPDEELESVSVAEIQAGIDAVVEAGEQAQITVMELIEEYNEGLTAKKESEFETALVEALARWRAVHDYASEAQLDHRFGSDEYVEWQSYVSLANDHVDYVRGHLGVLRENGVETFVNRSYVDPAQLPDLGHLDDAELIETIRDETWREKAYEDAENISPEEADEKFFGVYADDDVDDLHRGG